LEDEILKLLTLGAALTVAVTAVLLEETQPVDERLLACA
jgi:hypothetical protein